MEAVHPARPRRDPEKLARPRERALVFGAHLAAWRSQNPVILPREFSRLQPPSAGQIARVAALPAGRQPDDHLRCSALAELGRVQDRCSKKLLLENELRCVLDHAALDVLHGDDCGCCRGYREAQKLPKRSALHRQQTAVGTAMTPPMRQGEEPRANRHTPGLKFDPSTWVTTASEQVGFDRVSLEKARDVFTSADPRFWDDFAGDFFHSTLSGDWVRGRFREDGPAIQRKPAAGEKPSRWKGGLIREVVVWNWSNELSGGATNIIEFFDVRLEWPEPGQTGVYEYRYRLHHCIGAKFFGAYLPGGIDVDEGHFKATWMPDGDGSKSGTLAIDALKSLHYTPQPGAPKNLDVFMNLMAPALTSLFMRQAALHSVAAILER